MAKHKKNKKQPKPAKVKLDPNKTARIANEALEAARSGDPQRAYKMLHAARERSPKHGGILLNLGMVCISLSMYDEAEENFVSTLKAEPAFYEQLMRMAKDHDSCGRYQASICCLKALSQAYPENANIWCDLGLVSSAIGDLQKAESCFATALKKDPSHARTYYGLSRLGRLDESHFDRLSSLASSITGENSRFVSYALGMHAHFNGEFAQAINHWKQANAYAPANFDRSPQLSVSDLKGHSTLLMELFDSSKFSGNQFAESRMSSPLIIVGMPCSGVSSMGGMLAENPEFISGGAHPWFNHAVGRMLQQSDGDFRTVVGKINAPAIAHLRQEYLASLNPNNEEGKTIIDSNPYNFLNLWLVAMLLPEARIIHCRRNQNETVASIFATDDFYQPYTRDLACIGEYYQIEENLMSFWKDVLPLKITTIDYAPDLGSLLSEFADMAGQNTVLLPSDTPQMIGKSDDYSKFITELAGLSLNFNNGGGLFTPTVEIPEATDGFKLKFD